MNSEMLTLCAPAHPTPPRAAPKLPMSPFWKPIDTSWHGNEPARLHNHHAKTMCLKQGRPQSHELWRLAQFHGMSSLMRAFGQP